MENSIQEEDFEREFDKDSVYLYEKETEQWLWWHEQWRREEGAVIMEGEEIYEKETIFG